LLDLLFCWLALDHVRASIPKLVGILDSTMASGQKGLEFPVCCSILQIVSQRSDVIAIFFPAPEARQLKALAPSTSAWGFVFMGMAAIN
jgi:hypothetical protein